MSDPDRVRAQRIFADAQETLAAADLLKHVSMNIASPDGKKTAVRMWLDEPSADVAAEIEQSLRARYLMLVGAGFMKPGSIEEQLARGEVVAVERAARG